MRFGFHLLDFTHPGQPRSTAPIVAATARNAEAAGAAWFTVMDHYFQMDGFQTAHDPMLEGYTTLGFIAAHTERMKLGTLVSGVTYRHPGLLAKIATTLDVLSEGRAMLGIGAAWYEREHVALGIPYPPIAERFERLEEAIQIALQMWSDDDGPYLGKHYQLAETICEPRSIQRPHPPLLIGGSGERKTLRLVAKYADASNLLGVDPEAAVHKLQVLAAHCDAEGRDYDAIEKTVDAGDLNPVEEPDAFLRLAEAYARAGIDHIHVRTMTDDPVGYVARFGELVAPRLVEV